MFSLVVFVSLSLTPFVAAQSNNTAIQVEAIQAHFTAAGLVPSLLPTFDPSALLTLNYAGVGDISPGQLLDHDQVAPTPTVTVTPANSSVSTTGTYTITMVDANVVGTDESAGQTRHWLVNGVTITGSTVSNSSAVAITEYAGPAPAAGEGPHRYVVLLYSQPSTFTPPAAYSQPNMGVGVFSLADYVKNSGLGPLVAGTYITVEQGVATVSLSPTSAVVTSTLVPPSTSTGTKASTATGSTKTGNSAATMKLSGGLMLALVGILTFAAV